MYTYSYVHIYAYAIHIYCMKKYFILAISFAMAFTSYSQSLGYTDLGVLFSENDNNGTARFTAMSGAFGATLLPC